MVRPCVHHRCGDPCAWSRRYCDAPGAPRGMGDAVACSSIRRREERCLGLCLMTIRTVCGTRISSGGYGMLASGFWHGRLRMVFQMIFHVCRLQTEKMSWYCGTGILGNMSLGCRKTRVISVDLHRRVPYTTPRFHTPHTPVSGVPGPPRTFRSRRFTRSDLR